MLRLISTFVGSVSDDAVYVGYEPSCIVPDDPGEVVRHAGPLDEHARRQLLEQHIARLLCQAAPAPTRMAAASLEQGH